MDRQQQGQGATIPFPCNPKPKDSDMGRPGRARPCQCAERQIRDGDSCARCGHLLREVIDRTHQEQSRRILMAGGGVECSAHGCDKLMYRPPKAGRPPAYCSKACRKREARRRSRERARQANGLALAA